MLNFAPENVFLRGVSLYYFNMKKTSVKNHCIFVEVYGEHALAEQICQSCFVLLKDCDFGLKSKGNLCGAK